MIPKLLSAIWPSLALALGNHLWQSTLFAIAAGLLTLLFRKNHARTRYWLWLAASVKFLIPFSLLVGLGSHVAWPHGSAAPKLGMYLAIQQLGQPFAQSATLAILPATPSTDFPNFVHLLPMILAAIWLCGFLTLFVLWCVRWRRIRAAVRKAMALREGREIQALRRLEGIAGIKKRIGILLSPASLEPGIFGIIQPALLWPAGMSERLDDAQLDAIITHELWHVRGRDNLAAAVHMLVEAMFWFHPLVWWVGARMVEERERACDEAVIASGVDREVYAEGLLTVCKFYVESPLACIAGVAGAGLKGRIELIMSRRTMHNLSTAKKALLATLGTAAVVAPVVIGSFGRPSRLEAQTTPVNSSGFQTVSIQQSQPGALGIGLSVGVDNFRVLNYPLRTLIAFAYDTEDALISGPNTLDTKYSVEGKPSAPLGSHYQAVDAARTMVRKLLADQFQLAVHSSTQVTSAYVLTRGGSGLMKVAQPAEPGPVIGLGPTFIRGDALRMDDFMELLSTRLGHPVVDQTGLTQTYDFKVDWGTGASAPAQSQNLPHPLPLVSPEVLNTALETQLGLALQLTQSPVGVLIVDSVQPPENVSAARKPVAMDPALFDSYVGKYAFPGNSIMSVYRDNTHFYTQLSAQPPVEVFPESKDKFFANVVDAQISFTLDAQGRATALVLHQNGNDIPAPRIDDATAKQLADALKTRVQQQTATPGSEQALRQLIAGLASGKPDYDQMSPELAAVTRQQLPGLHNALASAGALTSLKFAGVGPGGADIYKAEFEHASLEWRISLSPDGKIIGALVRPAQ